MYVYSEQTQFLGDLDLNVVVREAQMSNGIKRGDFQRYRNYCSGKVKKIRKAMNFKFATPKTKFGWRKIEVEKANDHRVLQVLLFNAYKNWAYANEVKSEYNAKLKKDQSTRARHTIINKLKRSVQWAKKLEEMCQRHSRKKSALEAEAYHDYLKGMCLFEQYKWSESSKYLLKCREIYSYLMKLSDTMTAGILHEKIDQIDQSIKWCNFKYTKGKQLTAEEMVQMKRINEPTLLKRLQDLTEELAGQYIGSGETIYIAGEKFPFKHPKITALKTKIDELLKEFAIADKQWLEATTYDELSTESYLNLLSYILSTMDEIVRIAEKYKDNNEKTQAEKYVLMKIYLHFQMERYRMHLRRQERIFIQSYKDSLSSEPQRAKKGAPQTLAKLLTNINSVLNQITELEKEKAKILGKQVPLEQIKKYDELSFYYRTVRLHFVAQVYMNNGKVSEAYSLWSEAERCLQICKSKEKSMEGMFSLKEADKLIRVGKLTSWMEYAGNSEKAIGEVEQGVRNLELHDQANRLTIEQLIKQPQKLHQIPIEKLNELPLTELPPPVVMIPCRPIFYDIMDQHVAYPDIENRIKEQTKSTGWWGKLWK